MLGLPTALRKKRGRRQLERALGDVTLPSFPKAVHEVMAALRDPSSSSQDLAKLVGKDPALSVAVLRTANSAAFAVRRRVVDLEQAVTLIGRANVESILVSVGVGRSLRAAGARDLRAFWFAAARRALLARAIATELSSADATLAYTAALLSDLALPLLSSQLPKHLELVQAWRAGEIDDLCAAEQERFGWDHSDVGGWLCERWGLPDVLASAVRHHHLAPAASPPSAVAIPVRAVALIGEHLPLHLEDDERRRLVASLQTHLGGAAAMDDTTIDRLVHAELARADDLAPTLSAPA